MRHLADGALRRLLDEPQAVPAADRQHLEACTPCRLRCQRIAADAQAAQGLLAVPAPAPDPARALARLRAQLAATAARPPSRYERIVQMFESQRRRLIRPLAGLAAAAAIVGALAFTPAGALAQDFLTIFEPTQVAALPIDPADLRSLPDLVNYGTVSAPARVSAQHFTDAAAAAAAAHLPALRPAALPPGLPGTAGYEVVPGTSGTFTFSAAKARAAAAAQGRPLPPMPANLDGATLRVSTGNALVAVYGAQALATVPNKAATGAVGEVRNARSLADATGPVLVIGEMQAPVVAVSGHGVSVGELERYLLSQPGISPRLASAIRALGDPTSTLPVSTLPIPIPANQAVWQQVRVQGVQGVAVADNTGIFSGVVWEKGGVVYGLAGTFTQSQLLQLANGLR